MAKKSQLKSHLDAEKAIEKYNLNGSTFDVVKVNDFKNYECATLWWYFYMWILIFLSMMMLAADIYSCLNILVFKKWGTGDYQPYAYSIAKWIFTGCIIFQFVLLIYHWIWALHIYRTKNIALVYLNSICKKLYSIKSYPYFCLLMGIDEGKFFDSCCFLTYYELDNAAQVLIADTPRQVINILTLRYYATGGELNNDILNNIKTIGQTNVQLSVVLSLMCLSFIIFAIFFCKFVFGMIMYAPLKWCLRKEKYNSFKPYCCSLVNKSVSRAVRLHHKSKRELLDQGILSAERIAKIAELDHKPSDFKDYTRAFTREYSDESIPMRNFDVKSHPTTESLRPNEGRPFLESQPSFDQLQDQQQQQMMYSTLGNERGPIMNKRLSSLNDKSRMNNNYNNYNNDNNNIRSKRIRDSELQDMANSHNSAAADAPYYSLRQASNSYLLGNESRNFSDATTREAPSKAARAYTPLKNWESEIEDLPLESVESLPASLTNHSFQHSNEIDFDHDLSSEHLADFTGERDLSSENIFNDAFPPPPRGTLQKASTEQFNHTDAPPNARVSRSLTDTLAYAQTSNLARKKPFPLVEEDLFSFEEPQTVESEAKVELELDSETELETPQSAESRSLDIIDAYNEERQQEQQQQLEDDETIKNVQDIEDDENDENNQTSLPYPVDFGEEEDDDDDDDDDDANDNVPYPVRGVSKYFERP
ncbi:uncharacterized protein LODBEIA_P58370 [Lodderomyces beijingensis]|uniref:Vacuolar membrane protein n=1 Tax=Lodderomyces beijingensis TaxID=1775926 RepID=A0ABP0ZV65_9ASCO